MGARISEPAATPRKIAQTPAWNDNPNSTAQYGRGKRIGTAEDQSKQIERGSVALGVGNLLDAKGFDTSGVTHGVAPVPVTIVIRPAQAREPLLITLDIVRVAVLWQYSKAPWYGAIRQRCWLRHWQ
jgi:hypothetical protein